MAIALIMNNGIVNNGVVTVNKGEIPNSSYDPVAAGNLPAGQVKFTGLPTSGAIDPRFKAGPVWTIL